MNKKSKSKNDTAYVYEIRITLKDVEPSIWRNILVEKETTLGELHYIIQDAMGWEDSHLHQFQVKKKLYGPIDMDERMPGEKAENSIDIQKLVLDKARKIEYEYDFGDGWKHEIEILRRVPYNESIQYPICMGGEGACPPEDSGGVWGFTDKIEALQDVDHPDHLDVKEWMGEYDPSYFSLEEVNERLCKGSENALDETVEELREAMVEAFQSQCGFCGCDISEEQEVFSLGIHVKEGIDVEEWEGEIVPLKIVGMEGPVLGVAVTKESEAKKAGNDIAFQLCSEECVRNLQAAIKKGFSIFIPDMEGSELEKGHLTLLS